MLFRVHFVYGQCGSCKKCLWSWGDVQLVLWYRWCMNWLVEDPGFWKTYRKDEGSGVLLLGWGKCWSKLRGCKRWWRKNPILSLNIGKTSGVWISQTAWDLRCFEQVLSEIPQRDFIIRKGWACSLWRFCPLFFRSKDYLISLKNVQCPLCISAGACTRQKRSQHYQYLETSLQLCVPARRNTCSLPLGQHLPVFVVIFAAATRVLHDAPPETSRVKGWAALLTWMHYSCFYTLLGESFSGSFDVIDGCLEHSKMYPGNSVPERRASPTLET